MHWFDVFLASFAPKEVKAQNEQRKVFSDITKSLGLAFILASTLGAVRLQMTGNGEASGSQVGGLFVLGLIFLAISVNIVGRMQKEE